MTATGCESQHRDMTLILGIGNPLQGDDGAGIRAVELLAERNLPANIRVEEAGMPGWGLPAWLEGWSSVIIVDAIKMGQAPGTWRCFSPEEVRLITEDNLLSLHQTDLTNGLALAQALDILPDSLVFYGIEPGSTDYGMDLSPAVNHNLPELVDKILADLGNSEA